ncbi:hypothetical protein BsWGS_03303 [Bradybaena similaris]
MRMTISKISSSNTAKEAQVYNSQMCNSGYLQLCDSGYLQLCNSGYLPLCDSGYLALYWKTGHTSSLLVDSIKYELCIPRKRSPSWRGDFSLSAPVCYPWLESIL